MFRKAWRRVWSSVETFGVFHTAYTAIGVIAGGAVAVTTIWSGLAHDLSMPYLTLLASLSVGVTLWCIRQLLMLFGAPTAVRMRPDYAYCLAYTGINIGYDNDGVQIGIGLQNASAWPLQYEVKSFSVVIGNKTIPTPHFHNAGGIVPRMVGRTYWYPPFSKDQLSHGKQDASVNFAIAYGSPKSTPLRILKMKIGLSLEVTNDAVRKTDRILSERESKYRDED